MSPETKICQNCKQSFVIEPDDFAFYEKIKVPPPTFCPECRYQRRLMVRNERNFYKRECGLCKKSIISMYSTDKPFPVYCTDCWWGDAWDPMQHGASYDWSKPFFVQMREIQDKIPRPSLRATNCKNSDYCNYTADVKDSYLCFGSIEIENCLYGSPYESKYCVDTYLARESEYCYECADCEKLSNCAFCQDCSISMNLLYCFDCKNCQDCIGCVGLRNKTHYIFNESFSKEEYSREKERIMKFEALQKQVPRRFSTTLQCTNVSGDHIVQSKNAKECFDVKRAEDCSYCVRMIDAKDTHDTNYCEYLELCYDYLGFWKMTRSKFSNTCGESSDVEYSDFCSGSQYLFGCVGLRGKQYCVLNKQYTKGEYVELVEKIKKHMDEMPYSGKNGRTYKYGEYFPAELSLLAYNESVAQDFFPLSQNEIVANGFAYKEPEKKNHSITRRKNDVSSHIKDVADSITQEVIGCSHEGACNHLCTTAFRIVPEELQFYKRMNLPIPLLCPNCRHFERLARRNPLKLWGRSCQCSGIKSENGAYQNTVKHLHGEEKCPNEFKTSYSPERREIVYCESCYNSEVV
jgi:hypothetical protein